MNIETLKKVLEKQILDSNKVFIVGHNDLDLDAIAGAMGMSLIVSNFNKNPYIIVNDKILEPGVKKLIEWNKDDFSIINKTEATDLIDDDSILIIVDTNVGNLVCLNDTLDKFKQVIIVDHHMISKDTIKTDYLYILSDISSACEIITALIKECNIELTDKTATALLSGIYLDTNNLLRRTTVSTFNHVKYLAEKGASLNDVGELLKHETLEEYLRNQRVMLNAEIVKDKVAIAYGEENEVYDKSDLASLAEILLKLNDVKTAFVFGYIGIDDDEYVIGVSARSIDADTNVALIMEILGGGGTISKGAARIKNKTFLEVKDLIIESLEDSGRRIK